MCWRHCSSDSRWLVAAGADVESANGRGFTPLHEACCAGVDCTSMLLAAGADVHAKNGNGLSALQLVAADFFLGDLAGDLPLHASLAAGADMDEPNRDGITVRQTLADRHLVVDPVKVDNASARIARIRLDFVRSRAFQVCTGLQSRGLDALSMVEILQHACGPLASLIPFHIWWTIATTVKHFLLSISINPRNVMTIEELDRPTKE